MVKKGWVYIIIGLITLGLILAIQYNKPKEVNWFKSYVGQHKIPYGTFIANELFDQEFAQRFEQVTRPPFEYLQENQDAEGTYIIINNDVNFGEVELDALLDWVSGGNTLFVASNGFEAKLLDTLNLEQISLYNGGELQPVFHHQLVNKSLSTDATSFNKDYYTLVFNELDTLNTVVLGEVFTPTDEDKPLKPKVDVIKQPFGKGTIILSQFPEAFTNYFILEEDNVKYTAGLMSYFDQNRPILMDNYHKSGKAFYTSPMYIFLNTKELKWAYYLVLVGALVYIVFEGKRKQRAIPVVVPLRNQTLAFTGTIADMYFETGKSKEIATHQISHFLDYIRTHFYLNTETLDDIFYSNLASRSNHSTEEVKSIFEAIKQIEGQTEVSNGQLQQFNKRIEQFKAKADGK